MIKQCEFCGKEFAITDSQKHKRFCYKKCQVRSWYLRNRDWVLYKVADYRRTHKEQIREYHRTHRDEIKIRRIRRELKKGGKS